MAFRGLFVGIDRYASSQIRELSCARRDAVALHALFSDTLGTSAKLLVDDEATASVIRAEFERLVACKPNDVVIVTFSGHGTPTHELVAHDTIIENLNETAIPLNALAEWFSRISARLLVCFLDCCFSGGMGAKVLQVETLQRDLSSTDIALNQISGEGRLVLTASKADEEAFENIKLRHGLLTYYVLEALQGAEEVRDAGKVNVYRLLEYITKRVTDGSRGLGKLQNPTLRGEIDGELTWPVFKAGPLYKKAFPECQHLTVTEDVNSLAQFGFPKDLVQAWAGAIPELNQLQIDAINEFRILDGEHVVVSAPTSAGKTMIGELAALTQLSQLGTEIGIFDSARAVSFHHKPYYSTADYTPLAAAASASSFSIYPILFAAQSPAGCIDASQVFGHPLSVSAHLSS